jgi:hypothetical protein
MSNERGLEIRLSCKIGEGVVVQYIERGGRIKE